MENNLTAVRHFVLTSSHSGESIASVVGATPTQEMAADRFPVGHCQQRCSFAYNGKGRRRVYVPERLVCFWGEYSDVKNIWLNKFAENQIKYDTDEVKCLVYYQIFPDLLRRF